MSYLTLRAGIPSFSKAVISFWFRIPQAAIDAAAQEFEAAWNSDPASEFSYGNGWNGGSRPSDIAYSRQPPQMAGIIPLLIFGKLGSGGNVDSEQQTFGSYKVTHYFWVATDPPTDPPSGAWVASNSTVEQIVNQVGIPGSAWDTEPSYIGVWCTGNPQRALLAVNLETGVHATITGGGLIIESHTATDRAFYDGPFPFPERTWTETVTYGGDTGIYYPKTESFRTHPLVEDVGQYDGMGGDSPSFGISVIPDEWHHLLLSFDLSISCSTHGVATNDTEEIRAANDASSPSVFTDNAPKMWIAYDAENKQGRDLSYYWPGKGASGEPEKPDDSWDPNEVLSHNAWRIAGAYCAASGTVTNLPFEPSVDPETTVVITTGLDAADYSYISSPLPTDAPMGLPGTTEWVDHIHNVEMAEFQMFTGITLDTTDDTSISAFVDQDGKPVSPTKKQSVDADGNVTGDSGSIELLGKKPEIMLHGQSNWINGNNTGTLGVDQDGNINPDGQFEPTALIKKYKPDPQLGQ
jgi:hypothetical protein